jgi:hypothetical protein
MALPKNAHDYAVAEAKMKQYVTLGDEYFRLTNDQRIVPLSTEDRLFLVEQGAIPEPAEDEEAADAD